MARNKDNKSKNKKKTPKVLPHAPTIASKKKKAKALTKKQLIQQEKQAKKYLQKQNENQFASLFGPLPASRKESSNGGKAKDSMTKRQRKALRNELRDLRMDIDVDGEPLHHMLRHNIHNNNINKNSKKKRNSSGHPPFQLQVFTNPPHIKVPWWPNHNKKNTTPQQPSSPTKNSSNKPHYLFGSRPPTALLHQLDQELVAFAKYVQVNEEECAARDFVLNQVESLARSKLEGHASHCGEEIKVKVFGSYATPQVCAFCSDIDMALFGIVPPDDGEEEEVGTHTRFGPAWSDNEENDDNTRAIINSNTHSKPNASKKELKQHKVNKWKLALEEYDQTVATSAEAAAVANDENDEAPEESNSKINSSAWQSALDQLLEGSNEDFGRARAQSDASASMFSSTNQQQPMQVQQLSQSQPSESQEEEEDDDRKMPAIQEEGDDRKLPANEPEVVDLYQNDVDEDGDRKPAAQVASKAELVDLANDTNNRDGNNDNNGEYKEAPANKKQRTSQTAEEDKNQFDDADADATDNPAKEIMSAASISSDHTAQASNKKPAPQNDAANQFDDAENDEVFFVVDRVGADDNSVKADDETQQSSVPKAAAPVIEVDDDSGSDSEDDTADKLASMTARKQQPSSYREQAVISLSSDGENEEGQDDDDDDEVQIVDETNVDIDDGANQDEKEEFNEDDAWKNNDMELSIVSRPAAPTMAKAIGPQGETRTKVVKALSALGNILQRRQYCHQMQVIRHARVPIVKFQTRLGMEGDICIGGHNGTDTSQFAMSQVEKYESFAPVVMALKIMLWQQKLDTPFVGGLGSYKLYVLVAHHLEQHLAMGGSDSPGEVFLGFIARYGDVRLGPGSLIGSHKRADGRLWTPLKRESVLKTSDGYSADMQAVHLLRHCSDLFQNCWKQLSMANMRMQAHSNRKKLSSSPSVLMDIYNISKLAKDRSDSYEKAALLAKYNKGASQERRRERRFQERSQQEQPHKKKYSKNGKNKRSGANTDKPNPKRRKSA